MKLPRSKFAAISLATSLSLVSTVSFSAAFGIAENSALGIGNAFAGGAASAEDASTVWYNPAGMTRIKGNQLVIGGHLIAPSFDFDDKGSTTALSTPIAGDSSEDGGRFAVVPNFYYVHSLSNDLKVGIGITAPFGLATKYDSDWVGKYQAIESEIVTVNVNPSVAWQVSPDLSLGLGVSIQYIEATLNNKIDFASLCVGTAVANAVPLAVCAGVPAGTDGFSHLEGDDISYGFNFGALYQLSEQTRVGLAYRSEVRHELEGDADFDVPASVPTIPFLGGAIAANFVDADINVQPDLPASFSLSIHHQWNNRVAVMADATWVGWSSLPALIINFESPSPLGSVPEELKLKDNIRLSVGATYTTDGPWTFRTGFAYDEGAARNAASRSSRFPDNDRYWLTFGASYQLNDSMSIDTGYAHIFVPDTKIDRFGGSASTLTGDYESDADILSAQLRWDM